MRGTVDGDNQIGPAGNGPAVVGGDAVSDLNARVRRNRARLYRKDERSLPIGVAVLNAYGRGIVYEPYAEDHVSGGLGGSGCAARAITSE
jgi:hypothetical protein